MPADLDHLIAAEQQPAHPPCKYLLIVANFTEQQRTKLDGLTAAAVSRVLTAVGHTISADTVGTHRAGKHNCG